MPTSNNHPLSACPPRVDACAPYPSAIGHPAATATRWHGSSGDACRPACFSPPAHIARLPAPHIPACPSGVAARTPYLSTIRQPRPPAPLSIPARSPTLLVCLAGVRIGHTVMILPPTRLSACAHTHPDQWQHDSAIMSADILHPSPMTTVQVSAPPM
ncbi:hypothetical protein BC827DRAFT_1377665 [Russula dissimulans]|nr:hypothetical protein BC827DRAFT_1377665 [Russula dissimulans]